MLVASATKFSRIHICYSVGMLKSCGCSRLKQQVERKLHSTRISININTVLQYMRTIYVLAKLVKCKEESKYMKNINTNKYKYKLFNLFPSNSVTVNKEQPFKSKCFVYRFRADEDGTGVHPQADDVAAANEHVREALAALLHRAPDATLRMILRKP